MHKVIETEFKDHTVISVLHRFAFIHTFDRVLLLQAGRIIEHDAPESLLARDSAFRELYLAYTSRQ